MGLQLLDVSGDSDERVNERKKKTAAVVKIEGVAGGGMAAAERDEVERLFEF